MLATKTLRAAVDAGARTIVLGGGVAANRVLRDRIAAGAASWACRSWCRDPALCTDNGAMIGAAGFQRLLAGTRADRDIEARPSWKLAQRAALSSGRAPARAERDALDGARSRPSGPRSGGALSQRHGLTARKRLSQNHLVDGAGP